MFPALRSLMVVGLLFSPRCFAVEQTLSFQPTASTPTGIAMPVSVPLPAGIPQVGIVRFAKGEIASYQTDSAGHAWLVLPELTDRQTLKATWGRSDPPPAVGITRSTQNSGTAHQFGTPHRPVVQYQGTATKLPRPDIDPVYTRGGYLHPIWTPSGRLISDDYPPNHIHHHGIWSPWTKTQFEGREPDFWNMGQGKGRVEFVGIDAVFAGPVFGGVRSRHRFVDTLTKPERVALEETWDLTVFEVPQLSGRTCHVFDLTLRQTCATNSPLRLPKYHYGGLGFRGNREWDGAGNCLFLTSNGETNRVVGNETRGRWCWIGGAVDGAIAGMAILCHPDNFRAPQPMRLHPTEPFFCYAPSQLGDWEITPVQPYQARYRFIALDGAPDTHWLDKAWAAYAHPPQLNP
jgi:hypothetical protein